MIRKMDMSDIRFVYDLEREVFGKSLEKQMLTDEILYNDLARYFILENDGKRLAYAGIWITKPNAEIINIAVLSEHQSQGYGQALMEKIIEFCQTKQVENLTLEVSEAKQDVIRFYEMFGFEKQAVRANYYEDGTDALLMVKPIGGQQ